MTASYSVLPNKDPISVHTLLKSGKYKEEEPVAPVAQLSPSGINVCQLRIPAAELISYADAGGRFGGWRPP